MRRKYVLGSAIVIVAVGVIIFNALNSCSVKSYSVSELLDNTDSLYGKIVQVEGMVEEGSLVRHSDVYQLDFILTDENGMSRIPVTYRKREPDNLYEGRGVVVEGELSSDGIFNAKEILTSCASKYVPEE